MQIPRISGAFIVGDLHGVCQILSVQEVADEAVNGIVASAVARGMIHEAWSDHCFFCGQILTVSHVDVHSNSY